MNAGAKFAQWKTDPGEDLAERLRQFEVVCVAKYKMPRKQGRGIQGGNKNTGDLYRIGAEMFGLRLTEIRHCTGRAQNYLDEVRELSRMRARRGLPIDSDAMMTAIMKQSAA